MGVFPEDPCEYAVEFIRRMRNHPDIVQIPSSRQVLSIPRLILSRYYRKGSISSDDYIEISKVTSYPDNQAIAKDIAFNVLFPNYRKDMVSDFFNSGAEDVKIEDDFISNQEKSELRELQDLIDEIETSIDENKLKEVEDFIQDLNKKRDEEPYKSALEFFNDDSELYKKEIKSLEELLKEAELKLKDKINSLTPEELKAASELNLEDLIQQFSKRDWEKLTSKALKNEDITEDLKNMMNSNNFEDLLQSMKFLKKSDAITENQFQNLKKQLENQLSDLDKLFSAAKNLEEVPNFNPDQLLENSIQNSSFEHNFNIANTLDQYYGTNIRSQLLDKYKEMLKGSDNGPSLENLANNSYANKSWNDLFNQALQKSVNDARNQKRKVDGFKNLSHQLQQLMNSCENMHCSQKMAQQLPDLIKKTLESSDNPSQLRDAVEFLRKLGLEPISSDIQDKGKALKMPEEEIFELIEPTYQLLKKLIEKKKGNFERLQNLMERLKNDLNYDRIKELIGSALSSDHRDALGALGHFNLSDSLKGAQKLADKEGIDKVISCLTAGSGENLLKQWFIHRKSIPNQAKTKVKELAKKMLIELGIYYSRARLGTATSGPIPINVVRPYSIGDDFENIDMEETIFNILEKGKKLSHINYDDFFVYETAKGLRSACIELDISGSMTGDKLAYMAICVTMLVYSLQKDELAICFFESDTHILKEMDKAKDLEELADELLTVEAKGGTRLQKALEWARRQFKEKSDSREKLNIIFTDAEVYDIEQTLEELRVFRSMGIDFILVCPQDSFNIEDAERIVKIASGQLLKITDWNEFPTLISSIIRSRF